MYPYNVPKSGFLSSLKSFNFSGFIDGAQKTLGLVNQTIPLIYQVKPIISNAKTMFKIADVIKSDDSVIDENVPSIDNSNKPIFYI